MYGKIRDDIKSMWQIQAYGEWGEQKRAYTECRNVLAMSAEEAIEIIKRENPRIKIISVNHKGQVHYG